MKNETSMKLPVKIFAWFYGLQAFIVVPWFLGAIHRGEQSLWVWTEYSYTLEQHGAGNAVLSAYLYLIFYALPFIIAFSILSSIPRLRNTPKGIISVFGIWATFTFLFLFHPFSEFIRNIPNTWNGWLLILWISSTVFIAILFYSIVKHDK
jgi:hypothetical protein